MRIAKLGYAAPEGHGVCLTKIDAGGRMTGRKRGSKNKKPPHRATVLTKWPDEEIAFVRAAAKRTKQTLSAFIREAAIKHANQTDHQGQHVSLT